MALDLLSGSFGVGFGGIYHANSFSDSSFRRSHADGRTIGWVRLGGGGKPSERFARKYPYERPLTARRSTAPRRPLLHRGAAAQSSQLTRRPSGAVNRRSRPMNHKLGRS